MEEIQNNFWCGRILGEDNQFIFINIDKIVAVKPYMDDDLVIGYTVYMTDGNCITVEFQNGPFVLPNDALKIMHPLYYAE